MGSFTVANYITKVHARLSGVSVDDSTLIEFADAANKEIVNYDIPGLVWQFMQGNFEGTLTESDLQYNFEVNWRTIVDLTLVAPDASALYPRYMEYGQYRRRYPDPTALGQGAPAFWTTWGRTFLVGPGAPDQAYTLNVAFDALPANLTETTDLPDVPDEWYEVLVVGMQIRALKLRRKFDQAQVLAQDWDLLMEQMVSKFATPQKGAPAHMNSGFEGA